MYIYFSISMDKFLCPPSQVWSHLGGQMTDIHQVKAVVHITFDSGHQKSLK